jgi:TonB family protein
MKFLLLFCFNISILRVNAQDKNQFFALDKNMNQTVLDSSKYILWIHEKDSSNWQWDYYFTWGPLVKSTTYADHDGTIRNGRFCIYNTFGNLDSTGVFDHDKKNGPFIKLGSITKDSIEFLRQYEYVQDSLVKFTDLVAENKKKKTEDTTHSKESEYPGGMEQWRSYLVNNLKYPERAFKKDIQGKVRICFLVNTEGEIKDPFIEKSVEYSLDLESLKLIKNSGKWVPGEKDGLPVTTYKIQPVNYKLEN